MARRVDVTVDEWAVGGMQRQYLVRNMHGSLGGAGVNKTSVSGVCAIPSSTQRPRTGVPTGTSEVPRGGQTCRRSFPLVLGV